MEVDMLHAAWSALLIILDWHRLIFLFGGVCMGLSLGLLPGIGGVAGTALLLPFTYNMDAHAAFGMLLGLGISIGYIIHRFGRQQWAERPRKESTGDR